MQIRSEYYVTVNHCLVRFRQPHFRPVLSCLSASLDLYVMDKSNLAAKILQIFYTVQEKVPVKSLYVELLY